MKIYSCFMNVMCGGVLLISTSHFIFTPLMAACKARYKEVDAAYKTASEARILYVRRWHDIRKATLIHNDSVYDTITSIKAVMEDAAGQESFKKQENIRVNYKDIDALSGFTLKPLADTPNIAPETVDMADLQETFAQACLAMDMAWQDFCTSAPEFSLDNNPFTFHSGDHHETL